MVTLVDDGASTAKKGLHENLGLRMVNQSDESERSGVARPGAAAPRAISSREILGDDKLVIIRHEDEVYRLQRTAAGKLILTK